MVPWWRSFAVRFVALYTIAAVSFVLAGILWLYEQEKREVVGKFGLALESIAGTAAPFIRGEDLDAISSNADAGSEPFVRVRTILDRIRRDRDLEEQSVYVLRPSRANPKSYEFVAMLQAKTFVGDGYDPPQKVADLYQWVLSKQDTVRTELYTDEHGSWISGIAPILRADSTVAGFLQVDYGLDTYLAEVGALRDAYLMGLLGMVSIFVVLGFFMVNRLRSSVRLLLKGTEAIERQEFDFTIDLHPRDELHLVGAAITHALRGLRERFEMLKFLPRHTARMISTVSRLGTVDRSIAQKVEVAVFESDIRGFTNLSRELGAEEVVDMLNDYIRVQAELVEAAGGSIDKFMGDAVLAIFDGEDKERRVVECAIAIQQAVNRMNAEEAFQRPIYVGVGITVGEVVMGNMGSDRRMEYTVIGSPVNLAARLCSKAQGGEIVVSESVYASLDGALGLAFANPETVEVKGFDAPVRCYRTMPAPMPARRV
ncbi:MAG: adenylate/guanylate cyclase domain-containing protein [Deltaproteobacteria bacterium]|nr:adenylate/guanylate cyclase domain-containing protein [Deltaproteobacteria bacterium]